MDVQTKRKLDFNAVVQYVSGYCLSGMGRDELLAAEPFPERSALETELQRVLELRLFLEEGLALPFSSLPDTRPVLKKLDVADAALDPFELLAIHDLLRSSSQLRKFVFRNRTKYPALNDFTVRLWLEKSLQYEITRVVDREGRVPDTASDGLFALRRELSGSRESLRLKMARILRRCRASGWLMEDTVSMKNGRLTLGLKVEYKYKLPGFIQDYSQTGQTVFIEPAETLELSNRIQDLEINERREVERILRAMSELVRQERENLLHNQRLMASFDSLYARARFAVETSAVLPSLGEDRAIRIVRGFHPWLLVTHGRKGREVLPLDLDLTPKERALVISGPNAGGKSVAMKTAGLLCCMLQHGYLVPCSESSVFPLFDGIYIEIGDEQSIENDLSTFSSHLEQLRVILGSATARSLVLIDEICSGTDVEEGSAIARAVMEDLLDAGSKTIVTTHLGALKAYAGKRQGVVNGAMEFDRHSLSPSFRFVKGLPGSSFAFAMIRQMGFSPEFVERAGSFQGMGNADLESVLDDLRASLEENRALKASLESRVEALERERGKVEETAEELRRRERELRVSASREVRREIEQAKKAIREIVREVRSRPEREVLDLAREKLATRKKREEDRETQALAEAERPGGGDSAIREGDLVRMLSTNTTGEVVSVRGDDAVVRCGGFRLSTSPRNLEKISRTQAKKLDREPGGSWSSNVQPLESARLDLRGMTGDEAVREIERFIDRLLLNRMGRGTVIHGKGTGELRKRVASFLGRHPAVKRFRLGEWSEGGAGVTIIEL